MKAYVALGANLGDAAATLAAALRELDAQPGIRLVAASSVYRSAPVDAEGPDFLNAAAAIDTTLEPLPLLHVLQQVEAAHGRERGARNAPRTLDLDLLLFEQRVLDEPQLTLPHPRLQHRAFVLLPLLELAPDMQHPLLGPLAAWRERVAGQAISKLGRACWFGVGCRPSPAA